MGIFDFINGTNSNVDPYGYAGPQNNADASFNAGGAGSMVMNLLSDETFIRTLAETGAKIGGKGSVGDVLGTATSNLIRNKAVQREGEKVAAKNQTFQEKMLAGAQDGSLLSPTTDNKGADMIIYDGDGNITIKAKKSADPVGPLTEQKGLESITNTPTEQPTNRGINLLDFTSDQGSAVDFSGLDPEDVQMILGAKQSAGALTQKAIANYMDNKYRDKILEANNKAAKAKLTLEEKKLITKAQEKILERRQKIADKKEERKFKIDMELLKNKLSKTEPGSIKYKKIEKDMENLDSQIAARDKKTANGGMTSYQIEQNKIAQKRLEISMSAVEESKKKTAIEQQQDAIKYEEVILGNMNEEAAAPMMDYINQNQNKPYYYTQYIDDGKGAFNLAGDTIGAKLPLITKNGIQMDMASVRASAEKYGMSVEDFLASPGIGILIKGDNNDYQPVNR